MPKTVLEYLTDMACTGIDATVLAVSPTNGGEVCVVLDRTPFFPKGGGQPADIGTIESGSGVLNVANAWCRADQVEHTGRMREGFLQPGQKVSAKIAAPTRELHSRIHSAGEVICAAVRNLGHDWRVASAMHYPDSSRIVYDIVLSQLEREALRSRLDIELAVQIAAAYPITVRTTFDRAEVLALCGYDPEYIGAGEPVRIVTVGHHFSRPCMGTHVTDTARIGKIVIRSIKPVKSQLSIGYGVEPATIGA